MTGFVRALVGLAATLALPTLAFAQAGGGVCQFSGRITFPSPIGVVPSVCQSPAGCDRFALTGSLSGPACVGFDGAVSSKSGYVYGAHGCEGNVHGIVLEHSRFSTRFSLYGVCVGGVCSGGGYTTFGALEYVLVVDPLSSGTVASQCAAGSLTNLPLVGLMTGGAAN